MPFSSKWVIVFLFFIFLMPFSSASVLYWVNCDDLILRHTISPQSVFQLGEKICFYGAGFPGVEHTLVLRDPVQRLMRSITVPVSRGVISSLEGYSMSSLDAGKYMLDSSMGSEYVCSNQDGETFCVEDDVSCTLWRFKDAEGCITSRFDVCDLDLSYQDIDSDGDNWTDACDGFPYDAAEVLDFDGDGFGSKIDLEEFNKLITIPPKGDNGANESHNQNGTREEIPDGQEAGEEHDEEQNPGGNQSSGENVNPEETGNPDGTGSPGGNSESGGSSSSGSSSGGGGSSGGSSGGGGSGSSSASSPDLKCAPQYECTYWSECINGIQARSCSIINDCRGEPAVTEQSCNANEENNEATGDNGTIQFQGAIQESTKQDPQELQGFSLITGAVIRPLQERPSVFIGVGVLILIASGTYFFYKKYI